MAGRPTKCSVRPSRLTLPVAAASGQLVRARSKVPHCRHGVGGADSWALSMAKRRFQAIGPQEPRLDRSVSSQPTTCAGSDAGSARCSRTSRLIWAVPWFWLLTRSSTVPSWRREITSTSSAPSAHDVRKNQYSSGARPDHPDWPWSGRLPRAPVGRRRRCGSLGDESNPRPTSSRRPTVPVCSTGSDPRDTPGAAKLYGSQRNL